MVNKNLWMVIKMDFMNKIRQSSHILHEASEHTGFIKRIIDKKATKESYGEYLFNLSLMYKAIEEGLEKNAANGVVKDFVTKELYRHSLIEKDLQFLLKESLSTYSPLASTIAAVARKEEISKSQPELLIAYAYTRFLADLFGGRTFFELLSKDYKIEKEGLNYYSFEGINDMRSYAMKYASKLSIINISEDLKEAFLKEVSNAYIYNLAISNELEAKLYSNK